MNRRIIHPCPYLVVVTLTLALTTQLQNAWGQADDRAELYAQLAKEADLIDRHYGLLKRVVKVVQPSVVHIQANKTTRSSSNALTKIEEAGAGIIHEYAGRYYVITNRHVIADAEKTNIRIQLHDGRFFNPARIRSDADSDIAVMYVEQKNLAPARFGDSEKVEIGDFVVAVGSPFGLNHSVSYGIISAEGRRDLELGSQGVRFQDFLQTDAAINPGNSGGPLLNLRGEVIGINTAIASNSGGNDGIGFSIPINMVKRTADHLIKFGRVRRGFVGVTLDARFSAEKAQAIGLNTSFGARVSAITPDSPASNASLRRGDVILRFNGTTIVNDSHLVSEVSQTDIGRKVPVVIFRDGRNQTVELTIQERPEKTDTN